MTYWDKIGNMNNLILFAKDWKTLEELKNEFDLTSTGAWKCFRRVIKSYEEFEFNDVNGLRAGTPMRFRATKNAIENLENNEK